MTKKQYIQPSIKVFTLQQNLLQAASEIELDYSGKGQGTAGPDEIDDYSTYDSF
jgi:hypothetical protein